MHRFTLVCLTYACTAAICVTAYVGFLRFNELGYLRCCDVTFCDEKYIC